MLQTRTFIALSIVATLFFLTGVQVYSYAQESNDTSMAGDTTNATEMMTGNMTNATSDANMTGNVSGLGGQGP